MATITKPSTPGYKVVTAVYRKVKARHVSPFSLVSQTYIWSGEIWIFTIEMPPMKEATAAAWKVFLHELARDEDTWSQDMSDYLPSGVTGTRTLRLVGDPAWIVGDGNLHAVTFTAEDSL